MNFNKEILDITMNYYDYEKNCARCAAVYDTYELLPFSVPYPFQYGDIVYVKNDKEHPFIFDKVIHTKRFSGPYFNRMVED